MKIDDKVIFYTGVAHFSEGVIVEIDETKEIVKVRDSTDGTIWTGIMDHIEPVQSEN